MPDTFVAGRAPTSAAAVRESIARVSPLVDAINDLDRLGEDLGIGPLERLELARLLEASLGRPIDARLVQRPRTVAELMTALDAASSGHLGVSAWSPFG